MTADIETDTDRQVTKANFDVKTLHRDEAMLRSVSPMYVRTCTPKTGAPTRAPSIFDSSVPSDRNNLSPFGIGLANAELSIFEGELFPTCSEHIADAEGQDMKARASSRQVQGTPNSMHSSSTQIVDHDLIVHKSFILEIIDEVEQNATLDANEALINHCDINERMFDIAEDWFVEVCQKDRIPGAIGTVVKILRAYRLRRQFLRIFLQLATIISVYIASHGQRQLSCAFCCWITDHAFDQRQLQSMVFDFCSVMLRIEEFGIRNWSQAGPTTYIIPCPTLAIAFACPRDGAQELWRVWPTPDVLRMRPIAEDCKGQVFSGRSISITINKMDAMKLIGACLSAESSVIGAKLHFRFLDVSVATHYARYLAERARAPEVNATPLVWEFAAPMQTISFAQVAAQSSSSTASVSGTAAPGGSRGDAILVASAVEVRSVFMSMFILEQQLRAAATTASVQCVSIKNNRSKAWNFIEVASGCEVLKLMKSLPECWNAKMNAKESDQSAQRARVRLQTSSAICSDSDSDGKARRTNKAASSSPKCIGSLCNIYSVEKGSKKQIANGDVPETGVGAIKDSKSKCAVTGHEGGRTQQEEPEDEYGEHYEGPPQRFEHTHEHVHWHCRGDDVCDDGDDNDFGWQQSSWEPET